MFNKLFFACTLLVSSFNYCAEPFNYKLPAEKESVTAALIVFADGHPNPYTRATARYLSTMGSIFTPNSTLEETLASHLNLYADGAVKDANSTTHPLCGKKAIETQLRGSFAKLGGVTLARLKQLGAIEGQSTTVVSFDWDSEHIGNLTTFAQLDFIPSVHNQLPLITRITETYAPRDKNPVH